MYTQLRWVGRKEGGDWGYGWYGVGIGWCLRVEYAYRGDREFG